MSKKELNIKAIQIGFMLKELPSIMKTTINDISSGRNTSRKLAEFHSISINAASNRLSAIERIGAAVSEMESHPSGGISKIYNLTF